MRKVELCSDEMKKVKKNLADIWEAEKTWNEMRRAQMRFEMKCKCEVWSAGCEVHWSVVSHHLLGPFGPARPAAFSLMVPLVPNLQGENSMENSTHPAIQTTHPVSFGHSIGTIVRWVHEGTNGRVPQKAERSKPLACHEHVASVASSENLTWRIHPLLFLTSCLQYSMTGPLATRAAPNMATSGSLDFISFANTSSYRMNGYLTKACPHAHSASPGSCFSAGSLAQGNECGAGSMPPGIRQSSWDQHTLQVSGPNGYGSKLGYHTTLLRAKICGLGASTPKYEAPLTIS